MRNARAIIIGLVLGIIAIGAFYNFRIRPRLRALNGDFDQPKASRAQTFKIQESSDGDFDRIVDLPGNPIGLAINGEELLIGNRMDPWGFLRARRDSESFEIQKLPVIETAYGQQMGFDSITWNGHDYVGLTSESWFQQGDGNVFTIHDSKTLAIKSHHPAPKGLGCIAWTGDSYWAATRLNTEDAIEPAVLYHLDQNFSEIQKFDSPGKGCQGLTWDGSRLWFVDVFSDEIYILDVSGEVPQTLQSFDTPFQYLSGIAYDGQDIWISEYDHKQLHRLSPSAFARAAGSSHPISSPTASVLAQPEAPRAAEKTSDSYTNSFPQTGPEDMDVIELKVESRAGTIYGSFKIYFGEDLFVPNVPSSVGEISMPTFVRYTSYTEGGDLPVPIQYEYDAMPGENIRVDLPLGSNLSAGTYSVHLFLHAQFLDKNGTNRILNSTSPVLTISVK